ncbi:MAG: sugar/nucleoside kinase (ribokinase family) [Gammaproteobacteria bacterium]|jgi:sugar/nucleoside kinase (ribokinase family)
MSKFNVYAVGNALVDIEYHTNDHQLAELGIDKGVMTLIDDNRQNHLINHLGDTHESMACGGSAANTIIALASFGANVHYDCRVSSDMVGQFFAKNLKQSGVESNLNLDQTTPGATGKCLVFVTPDADRTMNTFLGVSAELSPENLKEEAIKNSDMVYLEGYLVSADCTKATAIKARDIANRYNINTALTLSDPNMVTFFRDGMLEMIGDGVDLLFANEEEACGMAQTESLEEAIPTIKTYCKRFAITRGKEGALLFDGSEMIEIAAHPVTAIDTLGAGDLFAGAFLYGLSDGLTFRQSGELASLASSVIVTQYGPRLPAEKLLQLLQQFKAGV